MRLHLLDGIRGIAALVVLFYHASVLHLIPPFAPRGYLFVDFFFLLSGFVLGQVAEPRLRGGLTAQGFIMRRIRRLWPVMAIGVLIATAVVAQQGDLPRSLPLALMALLLVPALGRDGPVFPFNGPQWSLSFELIANAIHALVLVRLSRAALIAMIGLSGAILASAIAYHGSDSFGVERENWLLGFPRVLFSYGFGVLLARDRLAGRWLGKLQGNWLVAAGLPVLAILSLPMWPGPPAFGEIVVAMVVLPSCFAFAINARLPERFVPVFSGLGLLSYPLYAVHLPVMTLVKMNFAPELARWLAMAAALFTAAAIARMFEVGRQRRSAGPALEVKINVQKA